MRPGHAFQRTFPCVIALGLCAAWAKLAVPFQPVPSKAEPGFTSLFNGKDLTGWRYDNIHLGGKTETGDKRFSVENGVLIVNNPFTRLKNLFTVKTFNKDFQLKLEFRAGAGAASGIFVSGEQIPMFDFGRLNKVPRWSHLKKFKTDDWNELDVIVKSGVCTTTVNGKKLTATDALELTIRNGKPSATLNGRPVGLRALEVRVGPVAHCLCNGELLEDIEIPRMGANGIGLQAETGKFEYRNMRYRELP